MSLILIAFAAIYASYKLNYIVNMDGYQMRSTIKENFIGSGETFGFDDGFYFAINVAKFPDFDERLDPTIATVEDVTQ